ncbi:MAG: serine--tRNA ligase, partial [Rhodothermaceae bacterium]|nr:serine--tRNA ligase [Rhodothermaceae bacterium]
HWEIAGRHGLIDFERGAKVAGAGFPFYMDAGAKLHRALINFFLDAATRKYREVRPPLLVNEASARGTGQLPDKEGQMYHVAMDGLYPVPTAEVPLTNYYRDEILSESDLPVKLCAYTPCWRREAGSYGAHVRGLNRLHQFDKVEIVQLTHPEQSYEVLENMCSDAETLLKALNLPYRRLLMCAGELGFNQTKQYDLEVWSAGQERWLEVSSISNFGDYQARRMNIRFRPERGGKPQLVHTLNGSALALPRVVAALLEHNQTENRSYELPGVLVPYLS